MHVKFGLCIVFKIITPLKKEKESHTGKAAIILHLYLYFGVDEIHTHTLCACTRTRTLHRFLDNYHLEGSKQHNFCCVLLCF